MWASSFHHMDRFIGTRMGGIAWNHWLELGSLWVLVLAVGWRSPAVNATCWWVLNVVT